MPDILSDNQIKTIAFYLPQYHAIPENDAAWGEGFTEWTNVKRARPLFDGHNQPRIPLDGNYYNLLDETVLVNQSGLAQKYGVYGFCYYHYWFKNGRKLLEKPVERMLSNPEVTIPYCLCWANESWTKRWNGRDGEIIVEQDYGDKKDWEEHFQYLLNYFRDSRYITINGKPLVLIYKPDEIPCVSEMMDYWQVLANQNGIESLCFVSQSSSSYYNAGFDSSMFDYQIKFEPFFSYNNGLRNLVKSTCRKLHLTKGYGTVQNLMRAKKSKSPKQVVIDYDKVWNSILKKNSDGNLLEGAFVDWDNTPRTHSGYRTDGSTPQKFESYFAKLCEKIRREKNMPVIFINAWNEWAEGAYLEPDVRWGYKYLEALRNALNIHS